MVRVLNQKKDIYHLIFVEHPNYDFFIKDYRVLDAEDESFEEIHCRNVIHHIPKEDLPKLVAEFKRLLKDGGKLIISEPREELHKQNLILDIIWYRFLKNETKIKLPTEYVDYKEYLKDFEMVSSYDHFNNEIVVFKKQVLQSLLHNAILRVSNKRSD